MNYWPGDELSFAEDYGRQFDMQLETERNTEAYSKSRPFVVETVKNFKRMYESITPEPAMCYPAKLPADIK